MLIQIMDPQVAVTIATIAAIGSAVAALAAVPYARSASDIAQRQLDEAREARARRREVAVNAMAAEMGRVARLAVRWQDGNLLDRAIADLIDVAELQPLDWGQMVLLLGELGQTGSMLGATAYTDMWDALSFARSLQYKAAEFRSRRHQMEVDELPADIFAEWRDEWLEDVGKNLIEPLLQKLDDASEALGEAVHVSEHKHRQHAIVVDGLKSKAAERWRTSMEQYAREQEEGPAS